MLVSVERQISELKDVIDGCNTECQLESALSVVITLIEAKEYTSDDAMCEVSAQEVLYDCRALLNDLCWQPSSEAIQGAGNESCDDCDSPEKSAP